MGKVVFLGLGFVLGVSLVVGMARFVYRSPQPPSKPTVEVSMNKYIEKQEQILSGVPTSEFDSKAALQLEQFTGDAIVITDIAKNNQRVELQQFGTDSTYAWAYNREGLRIILENLGLRTKHGDGKHCDSVGC